VNSGEEISSGWSAVGEVRSPFNKIGTITHGIKPNLHAEMMTRRASATAYGQQPLFLEEKAKI
jgi:hypothetical protein